MNPSSLDIRKDWKVGERVYEFDGLKADRDHLPDQADNVLWIGAIRMVGDTAAVVGADLILVDDPVERRSIAQPIFKDLGGYSTQS